MKAQRPKSILWFERFFIASVITATIDLFIHWEDYAFDEEFDAQAQQIYTVVMMLGLVVSYAVQIVLWYFAAYRASNIARWILVILTALSLLGIAIYIQDYSGSELVFMIVTQCLMFASILFLFLGGSPEWFRTKGVISSNQAGELSDVFK